MKPAKFTANDVKKIDLGNKIILKYPTVSDSYDIARMVVKGRFPEDNKYMKQQCL